MSFLNLWQTSILIDTIDDTELLDSTINFLLSNKDSLVGKEYTNDSLLELPEMKKVKNKIFKPAFDKYLKQTLNKSIDDWHGHRMNSWLVSYAQGQSLSYHNHIGSQLSSVLYLISDDSDSGGEIVFTDPRQNANRGYDLKFKEWFEPLKYKPVCGQIVVFPSFLYHYVATYQNNIRLAVPTDLFLFNSR
jgi:hypothetical protein